MDNFDFNDKPAKPPSPQLSIWDLGSFLVLVITLCMAGGFLIVFINPNIAFNPFPPAPTPLAFPTATITPIQPPPTWTPTVVNITDTPTLLATFTLQPSPTGFSLIPPSKTPQATATPKAPFTVSPPSAIQSTVIAHLVDQGCNWQGVGGTVDDTNNSPIIGMVIRLVGTLNGLPINLTTVSGVSPDYGKSGWEFVLGKTPVSSAKELYLQLLDQAGLPLSDNVYINTYTDCTKNLILVRFKKNR
jgi:hypothetical protein